MTDQHAPDFIFRILNGWHLLERWIAVIAFSLIGVFIFADVFGREVVGPVALALGFDLGSTGLLGAAKIALLLLVIGAFAGLGVSVATGTQIVPKVAFSWVPDSWGPVVDRLANLMGGLVFMATAYFGWVFVSSSREIGTLTPGLDWPVWIIQAVLPLGFLSAAIRYLIFAIWPATAPQRQEVLE